MLANDTAATGRNDADSTGGSKKGTTGRKGEGTKEGRSIASRFSESHKGTTAQDGEVESRREFKLSSVYCYVTKIYCLRMYLMKFKVSIFLLHNSKAPIHKYKLMVQRVKMC